MLCATVKWNTRYIYLMQVLVLNASKYQKLQKKDSQSHRAHTRLILLVHLSRSRTTLKLKMLSLPKFNFLENSFCVDSKGAGTGTIFLFSCTLHHYCIVIWLRELADVRVVYTTTRVPNAIWWLYSSLSNLKFISKICSLQNRKY